MRFLLLLLLASSFAHATTYHVSNTGNDSSSGTSSALAWKTVAHVNAQTFNPGDLVLFQAGGLWREILTITSSDNGVTFGAYGLGAQPTISGAAVLSVWTASGSSYYAPYTTAPTQLFQDGAPLTQESTNSLASGEWYLDTANSRVWVKTNPSGHLMEGTVSWANVSIAGAANVTVQGLNLTKAVNENLYAQSASTNISVIGNTASYGSGNAGNACIEFQGVIGGLIDQNTVGPCFSHGIALSGVSGTTQNITIQRNSVSSTSQQVDDTTAIYTYDVGQNSGNVIRWNHVTGAGNLTHNGHAIQVDTGSGAVQVYGNLLVNNYGGCLSHGPGSPAIFTSNICVYNNIGDSDLAELWDFVGASGATFQNNIVIATPTKHLVWALAGNTYTQNLYYGGVSSAWCLGTVSSVCTSTCTLAQWQATGNDSNSAMASASFVSALGW